MQSISSSLRNPLSRAASGGLSGFAPAGDTMAPPLLQLGAYNYPDQIPGVMVGGIGPSCWEDNAGASVYLHVIVGNYNEDHNAIEVGYYDGDNTWQQLGEVIYPDTTVQLAGLNYGTAYPLQARHRAGPSSYVGPASSVLNVVAPYKEVDGFNIVAAGDGAYHDTIAYWTTLSQGQSVSLSFTCNPGTPETVNASDVVNDYYRVHYSIITPNSSNPFNCTAWITGDVYSFVKEYTGNYTSMPSIGLTLEYGTFDFPTIDPGRTSSCWSGDGINSLSLATELTLDSGYSISLYANNGGSPVFIYEMFSAGVYYLNIYNLGFGPASYFEITGEIRSGVDGEIIYASGSLLSSVTPLETPGLTVDALTDGTDAQFSALVSYIGTEPSANFNYEFNDSANLLSSPYIETIMVATATMGWSRYSTMELSYSSIPGVDDPYSMDYYVSDGSNPPCIPGSFSSVYGAL
jgi:hypothetical protein